MTPETQAAAAAGDGFVTYDELKGPDLDAARWSPARLPLPTGGEHLPLDPNAQVAVGEGEVRVTIPRFSLAHDTFQPVDSQDRPELRASLVASQIVGLAMARHVVGLTPLAAASGAELVAALAPVFDHYLTGPLDST